MCSSPPRADDTAAGWGVSSTSVLIRSRLSGQREIQMDVVTTASSPVTLLLRPLAPPVRLPAPSAACLFVQTPQAHHQRCCRRGGVVGLPGLARGRQSQPSLSVTPPPTPRVCGSPPPVPSSNPRLTPEKPKAAPEYVSIVSPVGCRGLQRSGPVRPPAADDGPSLSLYALL